MLSPNQVTEILAKKEADEAREPSTTRLKCDGRSDGVNRVAWEVETVGLFRPPCTSYRIQRLYITSIYINKNRKIDISINITWNLL